MEQRTCNVIRCCKHLGKGYTADERIRNYICEECGLSPQHLSERDVEHILREAALDYIDGCDRPSFFMRMVIDDRNSLVHREPEYNSISARIISAFVMVQVKNDDRYINGFTEELIKQSEIDLCGRKK